MATSNLTVNPLFVGLTRPPMLFGVTYTLVVLNVMFGMIAYIMTSEFKFLALIFPLHCIGYYISAKEPLFVELLMVKSQKCNRCRNRMYHGANSYDQY